MWRFRRLKSPDRQRRGVSLGSATSVALVYLERDYAHYREVKEWARKLKDDYGIKRVGLMSYVEHDDNNTPTWLVKKLDSGFFCKSDLNWYGWPVKEFQLFVETEFDLLIDLEIQPCLPLKFVFRQSKAAMKVGVDHPEWNDDIDFRVVLDSGQAPEPDEDEVDAILHDPMEAWRQHTEKTFELLNQINFQ